MADTSMLQHASTAAPAHREHAAAADAHTFDTSVDELRAGAAGELTYADVC
jgi:hypothetical protein